MRRVAPTTSGAAFQWYTDGSHPDAAPVSTAAVRMSHIQVDPISSRLSKHPEARGLLAHGPFWGGASIHQKLPVRTVRDPAALAHIVVVESWLTP